LLQAIKDYDTNKWKVIGQKVGKPAKVSIDIFLASRVSVRFLGFVQYASGSLFCYRARAWRFAAEDFRHASFGRF
jgi:hypothetical protein